MVGVLAGETRNPHTAVQHDLLCGIVFMKEN